MSVPGVILLAGVFTTGLLALGWVIAAFWDWRGLRRSAKVRQEEWEALLAEEHKPFVLMGRWSSIAQVLSTWDDPLPVAQFLLNDPRSDRMIRCVTCLSIGEDGAWRSHVLMEWCLCPCCLVHPEHHRFKTGPSSPT
jgi:hypothetical protein